MTTPSTPNRPPRTESRALRHGDRVVAISTVDAHAITIHGFGTYRHDRSPVADHASLRQVAVAIDATDRLTLDFEPLIAAGTRHMARAHAAAQRERFHHLEQRRRATSAERRAARLLEHAHHQRRVHLDSGRVIDADGCFVMHADRFERYASRSVVTRLSS